jgi:group I intron endonuclease
MTGYIYEIRNKVNNKIYIGRTIQNPPRNRFNAHKSSARRGSKGLLNNAIRKYGSENFDFRIIEQLNATQKELSEKECFYIKSRKSLVPNGYNAIDRETNFKDWSQDQKKAASKRMKLINSSPKRKKINFLAGKQNLGKKKSGSKYVGIFKSGNGYSAEIHYNGKSYLLGTYKTDKEAAIAYDNKARELIGENAKTNFKTIFPQPTRLKSRQNLYVKEDYIGFCKKRNKFRLRIAFNKEKIDIHLGFFDSLIEAQKAKINFMLLVHQMQSC